MLVIWLNDVLLSLIRFKRALCILALAGFLLWCSVSSTLALCFLCLNKNCSTYSMNYWYFLSAFLVGTAAKKKNVLNWKQSRAYSSDFYDFQHTIFFHFSQPTNRCYLSPEQLHRDSTTNVEKNLYNLQTNSLFSQSSPFRKFFRNVTKNGSEIGHTDSKGISFLTE